MNNNLQQQQLNTGQGVSETQFHGFLRRHMTGIDIIAGILIVLSVMTSVFFGLRYDQLRGEVNRLQERANANQVNTSILSFTNLFIDKVLKAQGEIDFETRLNLESAVRGLQDEEILAAWQQFTGAETEIAAQNAVKNLLGILVSKIR